MKGCIFLFTLCTLVLIGSQSSGAQQDEEECPLHEHDVDCVNPCNTCEHQKKPCPRTEECTPGCDCKPGFLRNKFGYCIPKRFCGAPEVPSSNMEEEPGDEESGTRGGCPDVSACNSNCLIRNFTLGYCSEENCICSSGKDLIETDKREVAESGGCPSERICTQSCARRNFKAGICLGPGRGFCNCYTPIRIQPEVEQPGNREVAESGGCPSERICTQSCARRNFKSGICLGPGRGFCNCYTPVKLDNGYGTLGNREVSGSGGCPSNIACTQSCKRQGFKTGLCLGPEHKKCNCYNSMFVPAEGGSSGNREVADSGGCPSTLRCIKSCNRRNFETGVCQGPRRAFCTCYSNSSTLKAS